MAVDIGTLRVNLVTNTASFEGGLDKAGQAARNASEDVKKSFKGMSEGAVDVRHSLGLLDNTIRGAHSAAMTDVIRLFGKGELIMKALPLAAAAAGFALIGSMALEAAEKIKKHREEMQKLATEELDAALSVDKHADSLRIANLRLQDQIAILEHKPASNGIVITAMEAEKAVNDLIKDFEKAIQKETELMEKERQGFLNKLIFGDNGTGDLVDKARQISLDLSELQNKMDAASALGHKKEADDYKQQLQKKLDDFKTFIGAQQDIIDKQVKKDTAQAQEPVPNLSTGDTTPGVDAETAHTQALKNSSDAQRLLNDLTITYMGLQRSLAEQGKHTDLVNEKAQAEGMNKLEQLMSRVGQSIRHIAEQTEQKQEEASSRATSAALRDLEKQNEAVIKANEEKLKVFGIQQTTAEQHAKAMGDIDDDRLNFERQVGLISEDEYEKLLAKRLAETYKEAKQELEAKLATAKAGSVQEAQIEQQLQHLKDNYLREYEHLEQQSAARRTGQLRKMFQDWRDIHTEFRQFYAQSLQSMNNSLASFIVTGKGNWKQLAASAIENIVQIGLQYAESKLFMRLLDDGSNKEKAVGNVGIATSDAYVAAANTLAEAPWPINIPMSQAVLGVGLGYAGLAGVGFAEQGAVLPNREMLVHTHPQEMILPQNISNFIQRAAANASGGMGSHVVFAPTIHAVDAQGVDRVLEKHSDRFFKKFEAQMRRRNLG